MKLFDILKSFLLEKKGDKDEYGCAMLYFHFPEIKKIHKAIDKEDLYTEEGDRSSGIEDEPHCTILFGLHPETEFEDISDTVDEFDYPECTVSNASLFKNEKYDVLKFDVTNCPSLYKANEALKKYPYTNDFPDYHPHITIAYVKTGMGDKYVKMFEGKEYTLTPIYGVYSSPDGKKTKIDINQD